MTVRTRDRHPALAAFLSFLFPGLGQAYAGHRWLAVLLGVPVLLLVAIGLAAIIVLGDDLTNLLLSATFLSTVLVLDIALMAWRLFAIWQVGFALPVPVLAPMPAGGAPAVSRARRILLARRPASIGLVVILLIVTVAMHAWAGVVVGRLNSALGNVFSGGAVSGSTDPSASPSEAPLNVPEYSWDGTERVTFLLLGVDSGPGREHALTDTILVASVDPVAETAVLISIPRDTGFMPLPDRRVHADGLYPPKINQLSTDAEADPALWCPDLPADATADCGIRSLIRSVSLYVGIPINYYAQVDLAGFAGMIDSVGGLTLCLPGTLVDPLYTGRGANGGRGIELPAGCHHYTGDRALAYARSRRGYMEMPDGTRRIQDDFERSDRQQRLLLELRSELAKADLFFELPGLIDAVASTVTTDFPRGRAGNLASLLPLVTGPNIERVVLGLPEFVDPPVDPQVNYLLIPRRDAIHAEMERLFGADALQGWYHEGGEPPATAEAPEG